MKNRVQLLWICLGILAINVNRAYSQGASTESSIQFVDESIVSEDGFDTPFLLAQVVNPADKQRKPEQEEKPQTEGHLRSWELPPVEVIGQRPSQLHEEERVGTYAQPRWTAHRRFPSTRIYVRPEGEFEFEYWLIPKRSRDDGEWTIQTQYEWEMGLPYRFQLDLYLVTEKAERYEGKDGPLGVVEQKVELRWAFANWGKIPANPTLYLEWATANNDPDVIEAKLLLGGGLVSRVHGGLNLVMEKPIGEDERVLEVTGGLSYTILDERLSAGAEGKLEFETKADETEVGLLIGPSLQYRPLPQMSIDVAPLFGITDASPTMRAWVVTGWEF
ncbi:hypothetical protein HYR99_04900 [Candidatus Poribacteria bacterium]|nr:hypothetical protein [Candidatus Poribacteria bacterium]